MQTPKVASQVKSVSAHYHCCQVEPEALLLLVVAVLTLREGNKRGKIR